MRLRAETQRGETSIDVSGVAQQAAGVFAAYITARTIPPYAPYLKVHRVAGCVAFMGYALAAIPGSIWYKRAWSFTLKTIIDGLIYGMLTGGTFGWWYIRGH